MLNKEVQTLIYNALTASSALAGIAVDKNYHDYDGKTSIVYSQLSNVPHFHSDNQEKYTRVSFQLSVMGEDEDSLDKIYDEIERIMIEKLGFKIISREELSEDESASGTLYYLIGRFVKVFPADYKYSEERDI